MTIKIGILTVSDRAFRGEYKDRGGPAIQAYFEDVLLVDWQAFSKIVPDEIPAIQEALIEMSDDADCNLIITTGGTGPALRDVTPEATEAICEKMMPGFGELMRAVSLFSVPTAILSRQTAGIRNQTLIINLPGNPKAIKECLDAVMPATPYCIELIGGTFLNVDETKVTAFRPKK
ncbi:MAG: molybdopterin adenylyltransferase [Chloroflexota bacterium]